MRGPKKIRVLALTICMVYASIVYLVLIKYSPSNKRQVELVRRSSSIVAIPVCQPEQRVHHLRAMCARYQNQMQNFTNLLKIPHEYIFVNDRYKYVACLPQKAGCTSWKVILANNSSPDPLPPTLKGGQIHANLPAFGIRQLVTYPADQQQQILDHYYKFMVVRHPLDRLVSAYNDKIYKGNNPEERDRVNKLHMERHGVASDSIEAFLEYIVARTKRVDRHWAPFVSLCDPCTIKYDRIVKLETHLEDLKDTIGYLGPHGRLDNMHANNKGTGAAHQFTWQLQDYRDVNRRLFLDMLEQGYDLDMELFGYKWTKEQPKSGLQAQCSSDELTCC